jgi:hypothetical protein
MNHMTDRPESKRPQDRDFTIDQWEKYPFKKKEDPYENRSEERADNGGKSQYEYEGWEDNAFPNKNVSEQPAESSGNSTPRPKAILRPNRRTKSNQPSKHNEI